jgi:hypothetical protein
MTRTYPKGRPAIGRHRPLKRQPPLHHATARDWKEVQRSCTVARDESLSTQCVPKIRRDTRWEWNIRTVSADSGALPMLVRNFSGAPQQWDIKE